MLQNGDFIYYRGHEMHRINNEGRLLRKDRWYFEPKDWTSMYAYSEPFLTIRKALVAADTILRNK